MEQIHNLLHKNLKIVQDSEGFKFSLDSVLLSHFATIQYRQKEILDIGTGNAPIPLFLSEKTKAHITGIEIQKDSYLLAQKSVEINHLEKQIDLIYGDVKEWYQTVESDTFDLIVSNPPYFKTSEASLLNDLESKQYARHEISLSLTELLKIARKLLKNNGRVALVHRPDRLLEIVDEMRKNNIEPKRVQFVYPSATKEANILLVEGVKNGKVGLQVEPPLYVYDGNHEYTKEMKQLFE